MVVDIGGGTTEVAVISLGGIVTSTSIRIGGDELDEAIIQHVKKEYSLLLGERTSEAIKLAIASVFPMPEELIAEIKGRDLVSGLPKTITITAEEIRRAIEEPVNADHRRDQDHPRPTPPGARRGHHGQGHRPHRRRRVLRGLDKRLRHETGMPVHIAETPLQAVVLGSGKCLEEFEVLQRVLVSRRAGGSRHGAPAARRSSTRLLVVTLVSISLATSRSTTARARRGPLAAAGRAANSAIAPLQEAISSVTQPIGDFF